MPLAPSAPSARLLLCNGDATNLATWSNTPYFLLQAGRTAGVIDDGLRLDPGRLRGRRRLWNLGQALRSGRPGGFQYSQTFVRRLLAQAQLDPAAPLTLLSHYPLLPSWPWPSAWTVRFYIDATTRQVFDAYGDGPRYAADLRRQILEQEQLNYQRAERVITMSAWAARSVIDDYGIDPDRVSVVPAGANLDEAALAALPSAPPPPPANAAAPLRLGFLGKEWHRKGGPFLLELAEALSARGLPTVVRAIGPDPARLPAHPRLQPLGFINKQGDTARFVAELRSWHFGTLFSNAEAFGISNRECLRLGVPLLCHDVGGIASTIPDAGCGRLFAAHPAVSSVADWVAGRLDPYDGYLAWRAALAERAPAFTWQASVAQLAPLLAPPQDKGLCEAAPQSQHR